MYEVQEQFVDWQIESVCIIVSWRFYAFSYSIVYRIAWIKQVVYLYSDNKDHKVKLYLIVSIQVKLFMLQLYALNKL